MTHEQRIKQEASHADIKRKSNKSTETKSAEVLEPGGRTLPNIFVHSRNSQETSVAGVREWRKMRAKSKVGRRRQ